VIRIPKPNNNRGHIKIKTISSPDAYSGCSGRVFRQHTPGDLARTASTLAGFWKPSGS
jgi:hypothetical protein